MHCIESMNVQWVIIIRNMISCRFRVMAQKTSKIEQNVEKDKFGEEDNEYNIELKLLTESEENNIIFKIVKSCSSQENIKRVIE